MPLQDYIKKTLSTVNVGTDQFPTPFAMSTPAIAPGQLTALPGQDSLTKFLHSILPYVPPTKELEQQRKQNLLPEAAYDIRSQIAKDQGLIVMPHLSNQGGQLGVDKTKELQFIDPTGIGSLENKAVGGITKLADEFLNFKSLGKIVSRLRELGVPEAKITEHAPTLIASKNPNTIGTILKDIVPREAVPLERGFAETARKAEVVKTPLKEEIARSPHSFYEPIGNPETIAKAEKVLSRGTDEAIRVATYGTDEVANVVGQRLIVNFQNEGRIEEALNVVETLAQRLTAQGRAIQATSLFGKLTPEGVLSFAQRQVNKANQLRPKLGLEISPKVAKDILGQAKIAQEAPEGRARIVETAKVLQKIKNLIPPTIGQKIATIQTFAQLLNPKTFLRNILGNAGFSGLENLSDVVAAGLDSPLSLITGRRSTSLPSMGVQGRGFVGGLKAGIQDAMLGIDTAGLPTQFEIPHVGIFKGPVGRSLENLLNLELKAPDRAFYQAAFDGSLYQQMKAAGITSPTHAMLEVAHHDALYRTFQDDSVVARVFSKIKLALNAGKNFGLGDIVLKYPKTPGNLLARGVEYSPAGFIHTIFEATKPLAGHPFNQRKFVQAFARAITGTGALIGSGALLHHLGIITGKKESDTDIRAAQRTEGLGAYKINVSGLMRFVMSGMDPKQAQMKEGDNLVSYDWFQPQALGISIGANMDAGLGSDDVTSMVEKTIDSMSEGINTLAEQPLISGLQRVMRQQNFSATIQEVYKSVPSSFVPTILSQINQLIDNTQRNTYSPDINQEALNLAKYKIPGLSGQLPPSVGALGGNLERYQGGSNNLFNVFFNPAFTSKFKLKPEAQMVLDLYKQTGQVSQAPRIVGTTQVINGVSKKLTATQVTALQRYVGTATKNLFSQKANDPAFKLLSPEDQIKALQNILTDVGAAGKIVVLGNRPKTIGNDVKAVIQMMQ